MKYKCPECGTEFNTRVECTGFGGEPGDDRFAHAPTWVEENPDK